MYDILLLNNSFQISELSAYDDGNVLTHGGLANRKKRGRRPLDCPDEKIKVEGEIIHDERHLKQ